MARHAFTSLFALSAALELASAGPVLEQRWNPPSKSGWKGWKHPGKPWHSSAASPATPYPTGTATSSALSPTSTVSLPLVDSLALQASILEENLSQKSHELEDAAYSTPDRNRVMSSLGHNNTVEFITGYLDQHLDYFTYEVQSFIALYSQATGTLTVDGVVADATPFEYTSSTPVGGVEAPFVAVANLGCEAADYPAEVEGAIALISRGTCQFGLKSALAGAAGAVAAVVYDNAPGVVLGGTLGPPPRPEGDYVPSLITSQAYGNELLDAIAAGEIVTGVVDVVGIVENRTTYNVIAQTIGGDPDNVLAVGGHSDSVFAGPGINDDGSGSIGILEVAEQLSAYHTNNAIRFCWWSGEEFGLLGSTYYVSTLNASSQAKIRLYLNFDMIASPNYIYAIYDGDGSSFNISGPPGSAEAEHFFEGYYTSIGENFTSTAFDGRSDYGPFLDVGIASGGLFTGAEEIKTVEEAALFGGFANVSLDANYHGPGDNYTNLNFEAFVVNTQAIAAAIAEYGTSFDSLPAANVTAKLRKRSQGVKDRSRLRRGRFAELY